MSAVCSLEGAQTRLRLERLPLCGHQARRTGAWAYQAQTGVYAMVITSASCPARPPPQPARGTHRASIRSAGIPSWSSETPTPATQP